MIVDLDEIVRGEPAGAVLAFAEVVESGAEISFARQVEGEIRFTRSGETVWVDGTAGTAVLLTCGRCLRPFEHRLTGAFHEGYRTPPWGREVAVAGRGRPDSAGRVDARRHGGGAAALVDGAADGATVSAGVPGALPRLRRGPQ